MYDEIVFAHQCFRPRTLCEQVSMTKRDYYVAEVVVVVAAGGRVLLLLL